MHIENPITKLTQILTRPDGSQARIVAQVFFGAGLHRSVGVYVHRRENPDSPWTLCSDQPHPDWKHMPLEEYKKRGRSEVLRTVTPGEILKLSHALLQGSVDSLYEGAKDGSEGEEADAEMEEAGDAPR
ncbi:hypothetical protein ACFPOU_07785 [Massilia jejuensis]|uniref:Uncharacterized protein n=1 Tax=Massilia jejuensis TaxID=648894 RepID=A0ABW0PGJ7_9BURK